MILAGDIGGTNARLAYFQPQNGDLRLVKECIFPSRDYSGLGDIVSKFLKDSAINPEAPPRAWLRNCRKKKRSKPPTSRSTIPVRSSRRSAETLSDDFV